MEPCSYPGEDHPRNRGSKCKGRKVGVYLTCSGNHREVSVAGGSEWQEQLETEKWSEGTGLVTTGYHCHVTNYHRPSGLKFINYVYISSQFL